MRAAFVSLLLATCYAQQPELQSTHDTIEASIAERSPIFFFTQTITATSTSTTFTITTVSTATFCTTVYNPAKVSVACSGKRRRRGILMSEEEVIEDAVVNKEELNDFEIQPKRDSPSVLEDIRPTAVNKAQATEAPDMQIEAKREARHYFNYAIPVMPTFPLISPKFASGFRPPQFRQGSQVANAFQPQERQFLIATTSTSVATVTSTLTTTVYTSVLTLSVSCTFAAANIALCGS